MGIYQTEFFGSSTLGLLAIATENICYVPHEIKDKQIDSIGKYMEVGIKKITLYNSYLLGLFGAANSKYIFVPGLVSEEETKNLGKEVLKLQGVFNTLGNLILCNDKGIILSPYLEGKRDWLREKTGLKVDSSYVAGLPFPGILGLVTNKGGVVSKNCKEGELEKLEKTLGIEIHRCEYYDGFPGAEILANSKGLIAPSYLKAQELAEIQEGLRVY